LTKYKTAAEISEKVLAAVKDLCVAGEKISDICGKGDELLEEEISKVWRGKKVTKGNHTPVKLSRLYLCTWALLTPALRRFCSPHHRLSQLLCHALHPAEDGREGGCH
jgi:hypothetical protein